jgi:hypothetical protein
MVWLLVSVVVVVLAVVAVGLAALAVRVVLALTFFLPYMLFFGLFVFEGNYHYLIHYEDLLSIVRFLMLV